MTPVAGSTYEHADIQLWTADRLHPSLVCVIPSPSPGNTPESEAQS